MTWQSAELSHNSSTALNKLDKHRLCTDHQFPQGHHGKTVGTLLVKL